MIEVALSLELAHPLKAGGRSPVMVAPLATRRIVGAIFMRSFRILGLIPDARFQTVANLPTSKSLLAKARDRSDQAAWRRLTELYEPLVERWVRPHVAQRADAEDVVQEVLTTLVRELPGFDHNQRPGAFRAWLRTITVHRLRTYWEKRDARPAAAGGQAHGEALAQRVRSRQCHRFQPNSAVFQH